MSDELIEKLRLVMQAIRQGLLMEPVKQGSLSLPDPLCPKCGNQLTVRWRGDALAVTCWSPATRDCDFAVVEQRN